MRTATLAALLALSACTPPPAVLHPVRRYVSPECDGTCEERAEITYLGVGGFLVRFRNDAILTAPFFSTPRLSAVVAAGRIDPNPERIERGMRLLPDRSNVRALLVGHSHYDHLMDVPYVAKHYFPGVPVYGNRSMENILASDSIRDRLVALDDSAGDWRTPGRWIYPSADSTVRFMALRSEHARHLPLVKAFYRRQTTPRPHLPGNAWEWAEGQTLAFVIDFLDGKNGPPLFRVHYQDAASNEPAGLPPRLEEPARRYDVSIVCAGNFDRVRDYPQWVVKRLAPRHVVVGHWEDFFEPQTDTQKMIPFARGTRLVERIDGALAPDADRTTPRPGARMRFCVCPRDGERG